MNLHHIRRVLAKGGDHLGDLVFWSLADARVDRAALESLWAGAGLPTELLPDPPSAEKALKQAVREAQVGRRDRLIRLGLEAEAEIVFAIVREQRDDIGNLSFHQEARVRLDRVTESVTSDDLGHEVVQAVSGLFMELRTTHTTDDVRRAIVKALASWAAVTLREGGGVYFVPAPFGAALRALQKAVEKIGASRMYLLPVHQSAEAEQALGELAAASIEAELAALQGEIADFLATPPERASTLLRRFDAYEALRNRAKLYRDVLNVEVLDLDHQLDRLSTAVEEMLHQKAA